MSRYHIVNQGEHISGIASRYGFGDFLAIWRHPANEDLRKNRPNPHVLFPGDAVFIPKFQPREHVCSTGQRHVFQLRASGLKLRLRLVDADDKPMTGVRCDLTIGGRAIAMTTDGDGCMDRAIPRNAQEGILTIHDPDSPFYGLAIGVSIGYLDPVEEVSGQKARLRNLGYLFTSDDPEDVSAFLSAVEEFQCDQGLLVDGVCGPATQAMLRRVHGS